MISPESLAILWNEHAAALRLIARSRCAQPDDCVQEAFVKLACQQVPPDDPLGWLVRVVRNGAISRWRSEQRRRTHEQRSSQDRQAWFVPPDFWSSVDGPTQDEVQLAIEALDVETREIVVAHLWGGLTFRQIADAFELTHSTTHRKYNAGLSHLRSILVARSKS